MAVVCACGAAGLWAGMGGVEATEAIAAAARLIGLRGGMGDCSGLGFGGGDGARAFLSVLSWLAAGMITVERRDGGTGGGGAFASLLVLSMA